MAFGAAFLAIAAAWLQVSGFNGPAEWRWAYRSLGLAPLPACAALLAASVLILLLRYGPTVRRGAASLAIAGYAFSLSVVAAQPAGFERVVSVLSSRHSFSYLYDAALAPPAPLLLADFPAQTANLSMHSRTHPPGILLAIRGLDRIARALGPAGLLAARLPRKAEDAMDAEIARARERGKPAPARPPSAFTAVLLAFLLPAAAAATALPLHSLALVWGLRPDHARLTAALWLTLPAATLFTPSIDQALALVGVTAAAFAAVGGEANPKRVAVSCLAAGFVSALGCLVSYGLLVLVPFVAWIAFSTPNDDAWLSARRLSRPAMVAAGFALPWLALMFFGAYDPWSAFRTAISAHREMAVATRSYATWLAANPYDFALFTGPAVAVLGAFGLAARGDKALRRGLLGGAALLGLLWLSGSVRGEVGRIWLFAMPFVALAAAAAVQALSGESTRAEADSRPAPIAGFIVAAQALSTLAFAASMIFVD